MKEFKQILVISGIILIVLSSMVIAQIAISPDTSNTVTYNWSSKSPTGESLTSTAIEINGTEEIESVSDKIIIYSKATIRKDNFGVLYSQHSYPEAKWVNLYADASGSIRLHISNSKEDLSLETTKRFNDGKEHTIYVVIDRTTTTIIVDGITEASSKTGIWDFLPKETVAYAGADGAYQTYSYHRPLYDEFNGVVKDARVYYK